MIVRYLLLGRYKINNIVLHADGSEFFINFVPDFNQFFILTLHYYLRIPECGLLCIKKHASLCAFYVISVMGAPGSS